MQAWYRISSPPTSGSPAAGAAGAIGIITIGGDIDGAIARLNVRAVGVGHWVLREVPGIDTVVIARITPTSAIIFPHAGLAVMSQLTGALRDAGVREADSPTAHEKFPEAASEIEARMLEALARAESPLAIDLLLDQPRRWVLGANNPALVIHEEASRTLRRLIDPPLVVALGPPNIGKSSLVNALAGRGVAIVADAPGTTRDHVGVTLDLAGLVVRYLDTPGIGPTLATGEHGALDREAQAMALRLARSADLLLLCADAGSAFVELGVDVASLRVGLRSDLGPPAQSAEVLVSVRNRSGLEALTQTIRNRLVPPSLLADLRAWRFWNSGSSLA